MTPIPPSGSQRPCLAYTANIMATDDLVTKESKASEDMVLVKFAKNFHFQHHMH